jgi:MFS family permease
MSASYSLGCIIALPFVPWVNDKHGRRKSIILGSLIMIVGSILQSAAQNCKYIELHNEQCIYLQIRSRHVRHR